MIAFDLTCGNGHLFEGWFDDCASFEDQLAKGLVTCPVCQDERVARIPSKFAIGSGGEQGKREQDPTAVARAQMEVLRKISSFVQKNFDDVGAKFATEALKIHYGASEPRNIRGVSTPAEEKMLEEEGVSFVKMPVLTEGDPDQ
ncbi:MAG: DUF1178 family protein [Thermodesulfobacteriota bacterium]